MMSFNTETMSQFSELRNSLRMAQQQGDVSTLQQIVDNHPELEFIDDDPDLLAIMATVYFYLQQTSTAQRCLEDIDPEALSDTDAEADYGLALLLMGRTEEAERILEKVCHKPDAGPEAYVRLGGVKVAQNELSQAEQAFQNALDRQPDRAEWLNNLGGVKFRMGQYQEAIDYYDRALTLKPDLPQSRDMRPRALKALDRVDELIEEAQDELDKNPEDPRLHLRLALIQRQSEQWRQAEATLNAAIDRFPDRDDIKRVLVNLLMEQQTYWRIGLKLKEWVEERDEPDWTMLALNRARIEARFLDTAEESLNQLADTPLADEPNYAVLRAKILVERARAEEAVDILYEAIEQFPGNAEIRTLLAHTLTSLGRLDEAEVYQTQTAATNPMAIVNRVAAQNNEADDSEIEQLEKLFEAPNLESDQRARVGFTLAPARDKRKEYDRAFEVLSQANELTRRRLNYDWRTHRRFTQRQIENFTREIVEQLTGKGWNDTIRPIFVLGMPRSGTTLTEQILCSHPDVYGAGELNWVPRLRSLMPKVVEGGKQYPEAMQVITGQNLKSAANYYLKRLAEQEDESPRVVDKLPHNFDNVGLISLMFPNASIIHMDREPRDVAVSNFFQNFAARQGLMGFAYDLRDIGHMLNDHDRIMAHWHELFPGRIYELNYQQLVSDPENVIADLLEYCGLEWDDRVLEFYKTKRPVRTASIRQVREGIYTTSAEKWRRYEDYLDPLEEILEEGYKILEEADETNKFQNVIAGPTGLITE